MIATAQGRSDSWGHCGEVLSEVIEADCSHLERRFTTTPPTTNQPTPHNPPTSPALLLHPALIFRHFESFSHCIFYHFFLRLALSYASAPFKIQSQKNKTTRFLDSLSCFSLSLSLPHPIVNRLIGKSTLNRRISHCIRKMHLFTPVNILSNLLGNQPLWGRATCCTAEGPRWNSLPLPERDTKTGNTLW